MATHSLQTTNLTKKRPRKDHTMDNNIIPSHHTSIKRRKLYQYQKYITKQPQQQTYSNQKENHPFIFSYPHKPSNSKKQSLKSSTFSYINTCSPFQPSPIHKAVQKLNEFWSETKDINTDKTEMNKDDIFDFNSLLKSLTKDFEEEKEREEFNYLTEQIENLNINLSSKQIQKIIEDENEINDMMQKIRNLNIKVDDNEHNRKMMELLNKLSQLTVDNNDEFDCESDQFDTESNDGDNEYKYEQTGNQMENCDTMRMDEEMNGDVNGMNDRNVENKELDNKKLGNGKLKQKSIVHKCAKFMLSMLMIGAPVFYYYVS